MKTLFENCIINLELGTVKSKKGILHKKNKNGYHQCRLTDNLGNVYHYIHEVIIAEGLQLPKSMWPIDENGKRYVVDHIIPVMNGGTDSFENLRLIPEADNPKNELTRINNSLSKKGKHFSSSTEFKKGYTPWNKGKTYHTGKHRRHSDESKKKMSKSSIGNSNASKKVYQYTLDNKLVSVYNSATEASKDGFLIVGISRCCCGRTTKYKGYRWSYEPL